MSTEQAKNPAVADLQQAANTILAVLAPNSARLLRVSVQVEHGADTASTDGNLVIVLPPTFCGCPIPENTAVAVGLLAHEAGHFVQPLDEIQQVEETQAVPHWLANIVLDIHGEAFVESVFPALHNPLQATRQAVNSGHVVDYQDKLKKSEEFATAAASAALLGRFSRPDQVFDPGWMRSRRWASKPWHRQMTDFLDELAGAAEICAEQLPACLISLIKRFPELRQSPVPELPTYGRSQADALGRVLLGEASEGSKGSSPGGAGRLETRQFSAEPPEQEALRLSRSIRARFDGGPGYVEVAAPGQIDRHALARGQPMPFLMRLPGNTLPAPKAVLCLDISGSMGSVKLILARVAAQAIALSLKSYGGEVAGVLFSDDGYLAVAGDDSPLFAPLREWHPNGGTSFQFLAHVWRRWPQHLVFLLTDGYGALPTAFPADRERTFAVLIHGEAYRIAPIAAQVVELADLKDLPALLAMLIPRRRIV